jgi:hypothetical protein
MAHRVTDIRSFLQGGKRGKLGKLFRWDDRDGIGSIDDGNEGLEGSPRPPASEPYDFEALNECESRDARTT